MPLALLQALFRPRRAAILTTAGLFVIVASVIVMAHGAAGHASGAELGYALLSSLPLLSVPVVGLLSLAGVRFLLEHAAERALMSHETSVRSFDAVLLHEAERQALQHRNEKRAKAVFDFVTAVAERRLDPASSRVRAQADELERAVRADTSGGVTSSERAPELDDELDRLRSNGVEVTVRSSGELPPAVGDWLVRLLAGLKPGDVAFVRATILPTGERGRWRVATVVRPDGVRVIEHAREVAANVTVEDGQIHLEHYLHETPY
nr:hypothetical protein [Actinomycetales bacterium]